MKKTRGRAFEQPIIFPQGVDDSLQVLLCLSSEPLGTVCSARRLGSAAGVKGKRLRDALALLVGKKLLAADPKGYLLRRAPHALTVYDAVSELMGGFSLRPCQKDVRACRRSGRCSFRSFWNEMRRDMERRMLGQTFADLARSGFWKGSL